VPFFVVALPVLCCSALRIQLFREANQRGVFEVAVVDRAHEIGFLRDHGEPVFLEAVAERCHAAGPEPPLLGRGDLVADAFTGDLTLELCEAQQHVQSETAHRRRGVELLRN